MEKIKTCKDLINSSQKRRIDEIKKASTSEKKREEFESYILGISKKEVYQIDLSYGGPQDYFTLEITEDEKGNKEIDKIKYHYLNWFDGAEKVLEDEEFDIVSDFFSFLIL